MESIVIEIGLSILSNSIYRVFYFGCKLFIKEHQKGQLANEGVTIKFILELDLESTRKVQIMF
jgi:hypothetical protein